MNKSEVTTDIKSNLRKCFSSEIIKANKRRLRNEPLNLNFEIIEGLAFLMSLTVNFKTRRLVVHKVTIKKIDDI